MPELVVSGGKIPPLTLPVTGQLEVIYRLLKNGVNTKVTLSKYDGSEVVYELTEKDKRQVRAMMAGTT